MARSSSRLGLLATLATAVRSALRPGSPGLRERTYAVPRLVRAALRGDYPQASKGHLAMLVAAVLYVLSPIDLVPEALFSVFGLADDAVVVGWLVAALVNDTDAFLRWERARGHTTDAGPQDAPGATTDATVTSHVVG